MRAGKLAALIIAFWTAGGARAAEPEDASLSTMVAGLQRLQDQVAAGDLAAYKAQPSALKSIAAAIDNSSPDIWNDKEESNAAVIYLLSGGSPGPVARHLSHETLSKKEDPLMRAALAYATGHRREAKALFDRFDPRTMDVRFAGQFAYAWAELMSKGEEAQALEALDLARLLAPGGLVEEASLRREILILGVIRDVDRFCRLSQQYVLRFPRSIYFSSFRESFSANLERLALDDDFTDAGKYLALAAALPPEDKRHALLTLARAAVLNARAQAAAAFALAALQDAPAGSADNARARLYHGAARALLGDSAKAASDLDALPREQLDRKDSALLAAARKVARAVVREATIPQNTNEPIEDNATIRSAEEALQRSASLVSEKLGDMR
jgi:chemotaxis protein MotC